MAYEKQTWQTGDVITQEKLNHMEDGIEDAYELPAVTETDNGKVLGVENGAWSVVNGGGGDASVRPLLLLVARDEMGGSISLRYWHGNEYIEVLSFADLRNLYQNYDLALTYVNTPRVVAPLSYYAANESWGVPEKFVVDDYVVLNPQSATVSHYKFEITESSQTRTVLGEYSITLTANN